MSNSDPYFLHKLVFHNEVKNLTSALSSKSQSQNIDRKDVHGNTPLHLAVMMGHRDCVQVLLSHGAGIKLKNAQGWTPVAEAVSYGDRETITRLLKDMKKQGRQTIEKRRPELIKALECMGSFYMELRWDFQSWIPLLSRILPSDICKIYKKGANIRLDTTLVDFNDMKWERGDVSFLFTGKGSPVRSRNRFSPTDPSSKTNSHSLIVMDNRLKVYQKVKQDETENEIEDEVDVLMSSDIVSAQLNTKSMCFTRVSSGWFFKTEKREHVGPFLSDFYLISGFTVESRKRREHLTEEDLQKNRAIIESLTRHPPQQNGSNGSLTGSQPQPIANMGDQVVQSELLYHRRPSLMPPISKRPISWEEYISFPEGFNPPLGRTQVAKMSSKSFKATLAMSQDFPMTIDSLLNVLEIVAPFKQFKKLREFVEMKLPPGFPVKIDIPILPAVTARITFQEFVYDDTIADELFEVPASYEEDPLRFPDL